MYAPNYIQVRQSTDPIPEALYGRSGATSINKEKIKHESQNK
jgi:hypothetical protein